ncbi:MAG: hypothetical protein Q8Q95_00905 [bacterium]|nr:hypothetical protein [bacterium]
MLYRIFFTLMLFICLPTSNLLAETESVSWGSIKAEFSDIPVGKLVVTQEKVSGQREQNYSRDARLLPVVIGFLIEDNDYSIFKTNVDGETTEWLDFIPSISGRKSTVTMRIGFQNDGWNEVNLISSKDGLPSLYYKVVLVRYNVKTREENILEEWYGVPVNRGSTNMFLFEIGHGWKTVTKDTCCG